MWEDENETSKKICPQPIIVETDNQSKKKRRTVRFKTEDETYSAKPIPDLSLDLEIVNEEPRFSCSMPRSILRNYEEKSPVDVEALAATVECEREQKVIPVSTTTFTGTVVERDPSSDNNPSTESQSIKTSPKNGSSRRVSKFKMSRAQFD
ncbi:unnamed protein product [Thelazia callipaeda]|uniref:Shugoshin C-terminal domain-containing protein n=1 Tax=Thelazia callipaeda TaxID=103827 RepID=A0A0N5CQD4_THECL|nr:unnamed protein product [Thelazia callipaeda]